MRGECVYLQVMVQMYMKGWDSRVLAEKTGIKYTSMRRKLRGMAPLQLEEARRIQQALNCPMPLEELFARREKAA
ncbi:MAG: hypothetical protein IK099_07825 [Clostridia bacterium]|nr:hypothetical protein [Clostridia bacterium]